MTPTQVLIIKTVLIGLAATTALIFGGRIGKPMRVHGCKKTKP